MSTEPSVRGCASGARLTYSLHLQCARSPLSGAIKAVLAPQVAA